MSALLGQACSSVGQVFEFTRDILGMKGIPPESFEIQFVAYRNYNCDETMLLESSGWEKDPINLRRFLDKVKPACGLGNEAIEVGLQYINTEAESNSVSQIILMGDMPPNDRGEVAAKRRTYSGGESYWSKTKFSQATFYETELKELKEKGVNLHAYYLTDYAKSKFVEMANLFPEGTSKFFDVTSKSATHDLVDLLVVRILRDLGGKARADELEQAYVEFKKAQQRL
jgi:hypothetical protein